MTNRNRSGIHAAAIGETSGAACWSSLLLLTLAHSAFSAPIQPSRTFTVRETVAVREVVAAVQAADGALQMLLTDRGPTGRSAVLLQVDRRGGNRQWRDLKAPAVSLVNAGGSVAAFNPIGNGLRLLQPVDDGANAADLTGETAAVTGDGSHLVRLLRSGDLAVHPVSGGRIGEPRIVATAAILKDKSVCANCGSELIVPSAYVFSLLPGGKVTAVHRGTGSLRVLDLTDGKLLSSVALENEDFERGRAMYAALPKQPASSNVSNPTLVIAGAADESGNLFLLVGPFAPAEGARVVRVNPQGKVTGALRCSYSDFKAADGPPQLLAAAQGELYLVSRTGYVRAYPAASAQ